MKKLALVLAMLLTFTGCSTIENKEANSNEEIVSSEAKEIPVEFTIEKTTLSKGFQSIEPHVEIVNSNQSPSLLITLGVLECSTISIEKIAKINNELNIYILAEKNNNSEIVVPQITVTLENYDNATLNSLKYNIIGTNYTPIKLSSNKNEILNNIYAQFKITSNTSPEINLIKEGDAYIWDVNLYNVFAKDLYKFPLINVNVKIDSSNSKIIDSYKDQISRYINEGTILDYKDGFLIYKQETKSENENFNSLWIYNAMEDENKKIYTTHNSINKAKLSPDTKQIALIENNEKLTDVYALNLEKETAIKITPIGYNHTWSIKWKKDSLYFIDNSESKSSTLFKYDFKTNTNTILDEFDKNISEFDTFTNSYVLQDLNLEDSTSTIYYSNDANQYKKIDNGFNCQFIDDKTIIYLKNTLNETVNTLWIYDIKSDTKISLTDLDIQSYRIIDDKKLSLVARNSYNKDYTLYLLDLDTKEVVKVSTLISDNLFFDSKTDMVYLNTIPPIDDNKINYIYEITAKKE